MDKAAKLKNYVQSLAQTKNLVAVAFDYYNRMVAHDLSVERAKRVTQMSQEAAWFYCLATVSPRQSKELGFSTSQEFHNAAIQILNEEAIVKGWTSFHCCTLKSFSKRLTPFKKAVKGITSMDASLKTLLNGRVGNENRSVLGLLQKIRIIQIHRDTPDPNYKKTFRLYSKEAAEQVKLGYWKQDESEASLSTVKNFLKRPEVIRLLDPKERLSIKNVIGND